MEVVSVQKIISRGAFFSLIVAVLSLLIFVSGCGGSGGGLGSTTQSAPSIGNSNTTQKGANPLSSGDMSQSIQLTSQGPSKDGTIPFAITLKDEQGNPICATKSEITGYFDGAEVKVIPAPPASIKEVEEANQAAIKEQRYSDLRFDGWVFVSDKIATAGSHTFGVVVKTNGKEYKNSITKEVRNFEARRASFTSRTDGNYDGPSIGFYGTRVATLTISSQVCNPGDTITAVAELKDAYWSGVALISCSFADPNSIKLNGIPVPRSQVYDGAACYYPRYTLPQPQPLPNDPSYNIFLGPGVGTYTVEFKLDPQYKNKYFTYNPTAYDGAGSWGGPFVCLGRHLGWTSWDADEGFIIKSSQSSLTIENAKATPEKILAPEETTAITANIVPYPSDSQLTDLSWDVAIYNKDNTRVKKFDTGTGQSVSVSWNGTDDNAKTLPSGEYVFEIKARCNECSEVTATGPVYILEKKLEITEMVADPPLLYPGQTTTIKITVVPSPENWHPTVNVACILKNNSTGDVAAIDFPPISCASPGHKEVPWTWGDANSSFPPGSCNIEATLTTDECEPVKGNTPLELAAGSTPTIELTLDPDTVRPVDTGMDISHSKTTIKIHVKDSLNNPIPKHTLKITALPDALSGGHTHNNPVRPLGKFLQATAGSGSYDAVNKKFDGETNDWGNLWIEYLPSHTSPDDSTHIDGVGGTETIKAFSKTCAVNATATLIVKVPDLVALPAGTNYTLEGSTTAHPQGNHYGTQYTITALQEIAAEYAQLIPGSILTYNDISLINGGIFDLGPDYNSIWWHPSHHEHRVGTNVDMPQGDDHLVRIFRKHGATYVPESDPAHWHLRF